MGDAGSCDAMGLAFETNDACDKKNKGVVFPLRYASGTASFQDVITHAHIWPIALPSLETSTLGDTMHSTLCGLRQIVCNGICHNATFNKLNDCSFNHL